MVERFNRIVRDELLSNKELINTINNRGDYNIILQEFINNYNNKRPHSSIDYLSPMEYYEREKEKRFFVSNWVNLYNVSKNSGLLNSLCYNPK